MILTSLSLLGSSCRSLSSISSPPTTPRSSQQLRNFPMRFSRSQVQLIRSVLTLLCVPSFPYVCFRLPGPRTPRRARTPRRRTPGTWTRPRSRIRSRPTSSRAATTPPPSTSPRCSPRYITFTQPLTSIMRHTAFRAVTESLRYRVNVTYLNTVK